MSKVLFTLLHLAPKEGQSISSFTDPAKFPRGSLIIDRGGFAYFSPNLFHNSFPDIDPTQAKILAVTQKPINMSIFTEKSGPPAWRQLPTWYQVSENDQQYQSCCRTFICKTDECYHYLTSL